MAELVVVEDVESGVAGLNKCGMDRDEQCKSMQIESRV